MGGGRGPTAGQGEGPGGRGTSRRGGGQEAPNTNRILQLREHPCGFAASALNQATPGPQGTGPLLAVERHARASGRSRREPAGCEGSQPQYPPAHPKTPAMRPGAHAKGPIRAAWHPPLPVASRTQMGPMSRVVLLARGGQLNIQCSRRFQVESSNSAISDTGCLVETTRERGNATYLLIQESHG
ncbi:hypothetical protein NDU88_001993 [Pleurodeles waltl]|uniref:Uncharacterized protein n=1 Tax=Pleurodeles waltl TaxID=8319 RepID=A0AAV7UB14_PLEWA|nr:hypothetical protein NDU88_001993 [Pleurodeles waltl]